MTPEIAFNLKMMQLYELLCEIHLQNTFKQYIYILQRPKNVWNL